MNIETNYLQEWRDPRRITFAECDYCGNATDQTSSFFFTSPSHQIHLLHLDRPDSVQSILSCPSSISTITSFPESASPLLLTSFSKSLCLFDVRDCCISGMACMEKAVNACCCSKKSHQLYASNPFLTFSFVGTEDGVGEYDMRIPNRSLSFIPSSASTLLLPISTMSILQISNSWFES